MLRVMTNLSKVMDIFSDILAKSRFEQRPNAGNFIPRPNPKKNTTNLTKEFKPVPGTYNYRRDPDSTAKPKGKKADREFISDGANPDDATFVEGLEKAEGTSGERGWKSGAGKFGKNKYRAGVGTRPTPDARDFGRRDVYRKKRGPAGDRATIRKPETFESMQKAKRHKLMDMVNTRMKKKPAPIDWAAETAKLDFKVSPAKREEARFDRHKRKMGVPDDVYIKPGERHGFGGYNAYATEHGAGMEERSYSCLRGRCEHS